jgi:hypothetical protein
MVNKIKKHAPGKVEFCYAAGHRLTKRHRHLVNNGKMPCKANIAVAGELAGFVWFTVTQYQARKNTKDAA